MNRIIKYVFYDILRTRFMILYTGLLLVSTLALFQIDADASKAVMSMLNIVLMVLPLISIIFTTIHFYNSYEFIELMLAQPINRRVILVGEYLAVAASLSIAFLVGCGIPMLWYYPGQTALTLLYCGTMLTLVFVSLAFLASVLTRDKAKAIGVALLFWFYFSLIYDGLLLWIIYTFSEYPLEKVTLGLILLNPIDLARVIMLLELDISALMGYTGAFYRDFIGSKTGIILSTATLFIWVIVPFFISLRVFSRKDL